MDAMIYNNHAINILERRISMEDIETRVLNEIKEAWPYMSKEDKMYWLGKIEGIRDTVKLLNPAPKSEEEPDEQKEV